MTAKDAMNLKRNDSILYLDDNGKWLRGVVVSDNLQEREVFTSFNETEYIWMEIDICKHKSVYPSTRIKIL